MSLRLENRGSGIFIPLVLVFLSGFAALVYQVLWMRQLGLLFGNTAQASGTTFAAFFAGVAVGSWFFGKKVERVGHPLQLYGWLEVGIAVMALLYFVVLWFFEAVYPSIFRSIGTGWMLLGVKFLLSLALIFPPAFFMGGTIPVMGRFVVKRRGDFGSLSALMYGVNTIGAALGAAVAGFWLPLWLGFHLTCGLAVMISLGIGAVSFWLSRGGFGEGDLSCDEVVEGESARLSRQERRLLERQGGEKRGGEEGRVDVERTGDGKRVMLLSFVSGFGILVLEVLWTRMFSQVFDNSVYSFATVLVVVLLSLGLGAILSSGLARLKCSPGLILGGLIIFGVGILVVTPRLFLWVTDGMSVVEAGGSWSAYVWDVFGKVALVVGPLAILLGTIFPFLMKFEERRMASVGVSLGRLVAFNTAGAIVGAMVGGFFFLGGFGMWGSLRVVGVIYLLMVFISSVGRSFAGVGVKIVSGVLLMLLILGVGWRDLPVVRLNDGERLVQVWEGSEATVAGVEGRGGIGIKMGGDYSLGTTGGAFGEKFQADLPLMVYPETESVFFLGVGTGITAGGALDPKFKKVKRVVACELIPEVVDAARDHFTDVDGFDYTAGLFEDSRAEVVVADGRHYLGATNEMFGMINSDLFVPYRSGAGSLYSREHFESARERLSEGGVFVQWLPLYQLGKNEFMIVARTMVEVFDRVSMWRHNFHPGAEYVALIGHGGEVLPGCDLDRQEDKFLAVQGKGVEELLGFDLPLDPQTILFFYAGNLTEARSLLESYPVNTDNRPLIEYLARRNFKGRGFTGVEFGEFVGKVLELCPPMRDPLLRNRSEVNRRLPLAGDAFHRARIAWVRGDEKASEDALREFLVEWLAE